MKNPAHRKVVNQIIECVESAEPAIASRELFPPGSLERSVFSNQLEGIIVPWCQKVIEASMEEILSIRLGVGGKNIRVWMAEFRQKLIDRILINSLESFGGV